MKDISGIVAQAHLATAMDLEYAVQEKFTPAVDALYPYVENKLPAMIKAVSLRENDMILNLERLGEKVNMQLFPRRNHPILQLTHLLDKGLHCKEALIEACLQCDEDNCRRLTEFAPIVNIFTLIPETNPPEKKINLISSLLNLSFEDALVRTLAYMSEFSDEEIQAYCNLGMHFSEEQCNEVLVIALQCNKPIAWEILLSYYSCPTTLLCASALATNSEFLNIAIPHEECIIRCPSEYDDFEAFKKLYELNAIRVGKIDIFCECQLLEIAQFILEGKRFSITVLAHAFWRTLPCTYFPLEKIHLLEANGLVINDIFTRSPMYDELPRDIKVLRYILPFLTQEQRGTILELAVKHPHTSYRSLIPDHGFKRYDLFPIEYIQELLIEPVEISTRAFLNSHYSFKELLFEHGADIVGATFENFILFSEENKAKVMHVFSDGDFITEMDNLIICMKTAINGEKILEELILLCSKYGKYQAIDHLIGNLLSPSVREISFNYLMSENTHPDIRKLIPKRMISAWRRLIVSESVLLEHLRPFTRRVAMRQLYYPFMHYMTRPGGVLYKRVKHSFEKMIG